MTDTPQEIAPSQTANDRCTCAECYGEDPDCVLHGVETDWALENTTAADWQNMVLEYRSIIADLESRIASTRTPPDGEVGELIERLRHQAGLLRKHLPVLNPFWLFTKKAHAIRLAGYSVSAASDLLDEAADAFAALTDPPNLPPGD